MTAHQRHSTSYNISSIQFFGKYVNRDAGEISLPGVLAARNLVVVVLVILVLAVILVLVVLLIVLIVLILAVLAVLRVVAIVVLIVVVHDSSFPLPISAYYRQAAFVSRGSAHFCKASNTCWLSVT